MASSVLVCNQDRWRDDDSPQADYLRQAHQLDTAVDALRRDRPLQSAGSPMVPWQLAGLYAVGVVLPATVALIITGRGDAVAALLTLPFAVNVFVRITALWHLIWPKPAHSVVQNLHQNTELPRYSVLIPVFREAEIAPALVQAMGALDYPIDKLEIIFITEACDPATRAALLAASLPAHMQIISVPAGLPQTKPRALNYALQAATGELVAVFDAEDVPEPAQSCCHVCARRARTDLRAGTAQYLQPR